MCLKQNLFVQWLPIGLIGLILCACMPQSERSTLLSAPANASEAVGSCTLDLPLATTDEEAIWALVSAEGTYVVGQEINPLMSLWAPDARITDAKHTPQTSDDQNWQGADAIRYRYVRVVFPSAPDVIKPANLNIQIEGEEATTGLRAAVTATTQIGDGTQTWHETSSKGDRWEVIKREDCWQIQSLTFNLEAD